MNTLPAWFDDELKQVGVDFKDAARVAARSQPNIILGIA
jgi:hypothetical protein